ncbi:putative peptide transporter ptr2 [Hypsizygus marmoreus]|uniref:Peptide transporter ptr2 n=1 Tax=Hypsizygus marmoreus TaxID=39966 RepID=A0A369J3H4_HYPMA|nr:putative peptide transporter ptr2 [Hypsizygus marmoreus]
MTTAAPDDLVLNDEKRLLSKHGEGSELDGIHDGLVFPTEEERVSLRRVADSVPWNAYLIAIVELAERFSFYGSSVVFTNFIQQPLPPGSHSGAGFTDGQSGALGLGQRASTGLTTFYQFWCYITPLLGAYIADTYLGRFNTICIAVIVALIGHIILIVAAIPGVIEHTSAVGAFSVALIVMGLGTGLFKANISPLVAEQYKRTRLFVITRKSGERVIVDPALTIGRVYMYFYLFINIGALVGQISMTYSEKYVGFWLAYTLPTLIFLLCPIVLFVGRNRYVRSPPTGSILPTCFRLWRFAARGRWSINPVTMYRRMTADDFWENAKPSKQPAETKPKWMDFDDNWVDEVNRGLKACGVFCWYPIYWLTYNQLNNNLTSQAATMSTHGVPNDVLSNLDPIALIIFIPICDLLVYPALRRAGVNFSALKKITAGFATGAAAMIWAAVVQHYVYKTNPCHYSAATCRDADKNALVSPLNVWIQTGSYILIAFSEIFASITGLEYAFTKAPINMRSLVMSVFLFMSAISSALGEAFVSLSTDPLLVWNYGVMGVLAGLTGIVFWFSVRKLDAKEDALNDLSEGHVGLNAVENGKEKAKE